MRTRNQEYATKVFEQMQGVPEDLRRKYASLAHRLPALIRTAGLAQALAFVSAKGGGPGEQLIGHIASVVGCGQAACGLLDCSRKAELLDYMYLTCKVLAALTWYGRFAQAQWGIEAGADEEGVG